MRIAPLFGPVRLAAVIATLLLMSSPAFAFGNRQPPDQPIFRGLLAEDFAVQDAAQPLSAESLAGKKVVLIASANFNGYVNDWNETWRPGGRADTCVLCRFNGDRVSFGGLSVASEPHNMAEWVITTLTPFAREVATAQDFATAREQGGDYFVVIDYWAAYSPMGGQYRAHGGFQILDGLLQRAFNGVGQFETRVTCYSVPCTEQLYAQAMTGVFDPALQRLRNQLGPPAPDFAAQQADRAAAAATQVNQGVSAINAALARMGRR